MQEDENNYNWIGSIIGVIIGAVIIYFIFGGSGKYEGLTAEEWFNEYDYAEANVESLQTALEEANYNIDEANDSIDDAKSYAWESYDDMGSALEYLETVDNVDDPTGY